MKKPQTDFYYLGENNPLQNFNNFENKVNFSYENLLEFYYTHYPEETTNDPITKEKLFDFYKDLGITPEKIS